MKKLIDLFNKKYGSLYGVIDDSIDNEDVYKVYKVIKSLCSDDEEIMTLLEKVKLPNPKTAKESIEKININVAGGLSKDYVDEMSPFTEDEVIVCENVAVTKEKSVYVVSTENINSIVPYDDIEVAINVTDINGESKDILAKKEGFTYKRFEDEVNYSSWDYDEDEHVYVRYRKTGDITIYASSPDWDDYTVNTATIKQFKVRKKINPTYVDKIDYAQIKYVPFDLQYIVNKKELTLDSLNWLRLHYGGRNLIDFKNLTADDFKNTPFTNTGHTPTVRTVLSIQGSGWHIIKNTYQDDLSKSTGLKLKLEIGKYHYMRIAYEPGLIVTIVDENGNKINQYTSPLIQGYSTFQPTTEYTYILFSSTNNAISIYDYTVCILTSEKYNNFDSIAYKDYVDKMSPYVEISREIKYDNLSIVYNEEAHQYNITDIDEWNFEPGNYDIILTNNDGKTYRICNDKLGYHYVKKENIYYEPQGNSFFDDFPFASVELCKNNKDKPIILAYNTDWNDITTFTNITVEKVNYRGIPNRLINEVDFNKITNQPSEIQYLLNEFKKSLNTMDYYDLVYNTDDRLKIDKEAINESPYETSNKSNYKLANWGNFMRVYTKYSEGIEKASGYKLTSLKKGTYFVANWDSNGIFYLDIVGSKNGVNTVLKSVKSTYNTISYSIISLTVSEDDTDVYFLYRIPDTESKVELTIPPVIYYQKGKQLEYLIQRNNEIEYEPTGDYNPATKKYVDEKTASLDFTINNNLPVNGSLNLTTSKFQTTTLANDIEVILPTVEGYTEIHLFFLGISGTNVLDTNVAWDSKPTIEDNKKYEFIYTYVNSEIGWLGKAIVYTI